MHVLFLLFIYLFPQFQCMVHLKWLSQDASCMVRLYENHSLTTNIGALGNWLAPLNNMLIYHSRRFVLSLH